jgi:hypothetical protein
LAENYLVLLNEHDRALAAYVHALVNDRLDAEDILQLGISFSTLLLPLRRRPGVGGGSTTVQTSASAGRSR